VKKFVALSSAYEMLTGEELTPYGDLYRQVRDPPPSSRIHPHIPSQQSPFSKLLLDQFCVDIVSVCKDEAEVEKQKFFFPRYVVSTFDPSNVKYRCRNFS